MMGRPSIFTLTLACLSVLAVRPEFLPGKANAGAPGQDCNPGYMPVVFLHGFLASGDTYSGQVQRFIDQGYCPDRLRVFDWNTLGGGARAALGKLDTFVDRVLAETQSSKINLVGHSAGGGLGYAYLADPARAGKVAHYVHIGSGVQPRPAGPAGEVPTLNLFSEGDLVVKGKEIPGAKNIRFSALDHYEVATSAETFREMFGFFNPGKAVLVEKTRKIKWIPISGRVISLGENTPQAGATVQIYALDPDTGNRTSAAPQAVFTADSSGHWGPWRARSGTYYEFFVETGKTGERPVHYYLEPFRRPNALVYLRTLPGSGSPASLLLAGLPRKEDQSVLAIFSASRAVIHGRDSLVAEGHVLSSAGLCPAEKTVIAMFLYDNGDSQTSLSPHPGFQVMRSFLTGADLFAPASPPASLKLRFNGRSMSVPNWNSARDGVSVAVFE
ncbi:MAG: alpha/beta fold hydrolase [Saprospiraceae bacterium]